MIKTPKRRDGSNSDTATATATTWERREARRRGKRRLSNNGVVVIAAADAVCCYAVAFRWKLGALYVPDKWRLGGLGCSSARTVVCVRCVWADGGTVVL